MMAYMLSISTIGDSIYMPMTVILSGGIVSFARMMTVDKIKACLSKMRT